MNSKITWSAHNDATYLAGSRHAKTMRGAVRDAKRYGNSELQGEGVITIYVDGSAARVFRAGLPAGTRRWHWKERAI